VGFSPGSLAWGVSVPAGLVPAASLVHLPMKLRLPGHKRLKGGWHWLAAFNMASLLGTACTCGMALTGVDAFWPWSSTLARDAPLLLVKRRRCCSLCLLRGGGASRRGHGPWARLAAEELRRPGAAEPLGMTWPSMACSDGGLLASVSVG